MKKRRVIIMSVLVTLAIVYGGIAQAQISGQLWENENAAANNALVTNVPGTPANVTFTVPNGALAFTSFSGPGNTGNPSANYTIGSWLASGGATITSGSSEAGNTFNNVFVYLTGEVTVTSPDVFSVTHDDGMNLVIGSQDVIHVPGATPPIASTGTYTGPAGNFGFQLAYGEVDGSPAVLDVDLPFRGVVTPEPASLLLLGFGLFALGAVGRKMKK